MTVQAKSSCAYKGYERKDLGNACGQQSGPALSVTCRKHDTCFSDERWTLINISAEYLFRVYLKEEMFDDVETIQMD